MPLFDALRRRIADRIAPSSPPASADDSRRHFVRKAAGASAAVLGGGMLLADESWAAVESRAAAFGITPGTLVDAQGREMPRGSMIEPFIGTILPFAFNFAPRGWAMCDGQLLSIAQNSALFSLLGTIYGGDGRTTFALPDLRSRIPMHQGSGPALTTQQIGAQGGQESVTLLPNQLPRHRHEIPSITLDSDLAVTGAGSLSDSGDEVTALAGIGPTSGTQGERTGGTGGDQPIPTLPPYLVVNYCVAVEGLYPSRQ